MKAGSRWSQRWGFWGSVLLLLSLSPPEAALCPQFDLVCSDGWMLDMYQSTLNLGFLLGSFACGYFADRWVWGQWDAHPEPERSMRDGL